MRTLGRRVLRAPVAGRTWREFGYALVALVFAAPAFVLALLAVVGSAGTLVMAGLPVLVGVLLAARGTVRWFRIPARAILGWDWPTPPPLARGRGAVRFVVTVLGDPVGWRALLYAFVKFPLIAAAAYLGGVLVVSGTLFLTYPLWWLVAPRGFGLFDPVGWTGTLVPAVEGAVAVLVFPWLVRLLVGLDRLLVRALLAPAGDHARIAALESSRSVLTADAAETLRRVERDLHDGTQARLVSLGVTLSRIARRVDDPELAGLVGSARATVTDALTELRDIVRRIHPPALDAGLATALETLAARSAVPVSLSVSLPEPPSDATATAVYFATAELLTNVARHASATRARVEVCADGGRLRLVVRDDGRGGAAPGRRTGPGSGPGSGSGSGSGSGLAGLVRRARALDGSVVIDSPLGGPTVVTMTLRKD